MFIGSEISIKFASPTVRTEDDDNHDNHRGC